jgi:hypothetical protein
MIQVVPINDVERLEAEERVKMRSFAANYAFGVPLIRALRLAGFERPNKLMASKLFESTYVLEEIERNLSILRGQLLQTRERVIAQLDEDREFAVNQENPAAAVAATVAKAKILGFMDKQTDKNMPSKISIEWGEGSTETIYEKSNPLLFDALEQTLGTDDHTSALPTELDASK